MEETDNILGAKSSKDKFAAQESVGYDSQFMLVPLTPYQMSEDYRAMKDL